VHCELTELPVDQKLLRSATRSRCDKAAAIAAWARPMAQRILPEQCCTGVGNFFGVPLKLGDVIVRIDAAKFASMNQTYGKEA
jgi:hypothetical protein